MDLFDFFFPDQAQAHHLRKIASNRDQANPSPNRIELQSLRADVDFLTLVVAALLRRLTETQTASLADIQDLIDEIDVLDGIADGGLDPGSLRGILGVLKGNADQTPDSSEFEIVTTPRYRKR